jgi:hypothetical protein
VASAQFFPRIGLTPQNAAAGSGELILTISGRSFTSGLQVMWAGEPRPTRFIDAHTLKATITADNLSKPDLVQVSLTDTNSGEAASDPIAFMVYVPLAAP